MEVQRTITNTTGRPMLVFVEPYGLDYWLAPGESVQLRAAIDDPYDDFEMVEDAQGLTVWPSPGMGFIDVYAGETRLAPGHQRPEGWGPSRGP